MTEDKDAPGMGTGKRSGASGCALRPVTTRRLLRPAGKGQVQVQGPG